MALGGQRGLVGKDQFARGLVDHPRHQINAVDALRDGMFNLKPGVDLKEISLAPGDIIDELNRAGRGVADRAAERQGRLAELGSCRLVEIRRGCFLDNFLVSSL